MHVLSLIALLTVPQYRALRVGHLPQIDGRLDDEAWRAAAPIEEFTRTEPQPGGPAHRAHIGASRLRLGSPLRSNPLVRSSRGSRAATASSSQTESA